MTCPQRDQRHRILKHEGPVLSSEWMKVDEGKLQLDHLSLRNKIIISFQDEIELKQVLNRFQEILFHTIVNKGMVLSCSQGENN